MQFRWNKVTINDWDRFHQASPRTNLLQTWVYAKAIRKCEHQTTRFAEILDTNTSKDRIGFFQIQEIKIGPFHTVALDRGPLWFDENPTDDLWTEFFFAFASEFPKRFGRKRRFIPEASKAPHMATFLEKAGFQPKGTGYNSIWLDLKPDLETLRKSLKQKWRNALNQSERRSLDVVETRDATRFSALVNAYDKDRQTRRYRGASAAFIRALWAAAAPRHETLLLTGQVKGEVEAAVLFFLHGQSATYQIGWTSETGRTARAHHALLWQGICKLKERGVNWLDLGGTHEEHAHGVTKFKQGLGGTSFELAGFYI